MADDKRIETFSVKCKITTEEVRYIGACEDVAGGLRRGKFCVSGGNNNSTAT